MSERTLADIRADVDDVDRRLIRILRERFVLVREAGAAKRTAGLPFYDRAREADILWRAGDVEAEVLVVLCVQLSKLRELPENVEHDKLTRAQPGSGWAK